MNKPRNSGGRRLKSSANHSEIAKALAAQPNKWVRVNEYRAKYTATNVGRAINTGGHRNAAFPMYHPPGAYETRVEMTDDGWLLEARYVGEAGATDVPRETSSGET